MIADMMDMSGDILRRVRPMLDATGDNAPEDGQANEQTVTSTMDLIDLIKDLLDEKKDGSTMSITIDVQGDEAHVCTTQEFCDLMLDSSSNTDEEQGEQPDADDDTSSGDNAN